jgi:hypothetical protein
MIVKYIPLIIFLEKVILVLLFMKTKKIRCTNFHPVYNSEEFFNNNLLQK